MAGITCKAVLFLQMKYWENLKIFLKIIETFLDMTFGCINKISSLFYYICYTFFSSLQKQSKSVVYVLIKTVPFFKNLKNIVKQCISYSTFTTFPNIWKILVFNQRNLMFSSLLTYFSAIMLKAIWKIDQSMCCKYMEIICGTDTFWVNIVNEKIL